MACKKCASNKTTACACTDTSYTIPGNCGYGNSTCKFPSEPCSEILCTECVRHCHDEDKWCVDLYTADWGGDDGVVGLPGLDVGPLEFCVSNGERLDQMFQKLTLALSDPTSYPYKVKNFYVNNINNVTGSYFVEVQFVWFEFLSSLTDIQLWYQADGDAVWTQVMQFNSLINPLQSNTFTVNNDMIGLVPGTTYKFKLVTTSAVGTQYDPGSAILYVTIPE
tara:strand:+ start:10416 stop:11081 length:666 start_codon:yes stop_codon:yes gene_type:complete